MDFQIFKKKQLWYNVPMIDLLLALALDPIRIAVIPDTQNESYYVSARRAHWIDSHDFDAVVHVGDVTNWGARDWSQFTRAQRWFKIIDAPKVVAIGNHDTAAVGVGGSAYNPPQTGRLLRDTRAFNRADLFTPNRRPFEAGKLDNVWHRVNRNWAIMSLELWPRKEAVAWANKVIKARPNTRWVVVTHSCLNRFGQIYNGSSYGSTSPAYLRDKLVRPNTNVKVVLCGHIGTTAVTKDKQATWILTNETTPGRVRILELGNTVRTWLRSTGGT
jgi:DNA repair exonuclease SbcCD nuclease subunit